MVQGVSCDNEPEASGRGGRKLPWVQLMQQYYCPLRIFTYFPINIYCLYILVYLS